MFTVTITRAGIETFRSNFELCSTAWHIFGMSIAQAGKSMRTSTINGEPFELFNVRMAYMMDSPVEVEYANVTIA